MIVVLLSAYALVYFHRTMTGVMKPEVDVYSRYYGVDPSLLLAVMSSAYFYTYAVSQLFIGPLVDYYGVRRAGSIMLAILGLATVVMSLPNPWALIVGRAFVGFSATVAFISYMRSSALYFRLEHQGRLSSYALMVGSISTVFATYPLRVALNKFGIQPTLTALAIAGFLLAVFVYLLTPDVGGRYKSVLHQVKAIGSIARNPHNWGVGVAAIASYGIGTAYQASWGQLHLSKVFNLGYDEVSMYLMIIALVFAVSSVLTGYLSDKVFKKRKPFLTLATSAAVVAWATLYLASVWGSKALLTVGLITVGVSQGLHIVAPTMAKELYNPEISGTAVSLFNITLFTGIAVIQTVCSMINPYTALTINIFIAFIGILSSTLLTKETYVRK